MAFEETQRLPRAAGLPCAHNPTNKPPAFGAWPGQLPLQAPQAAGGKAASHRACAAWPCALRIGVYASCCLAGP